ncbi:MAG: transcriptional regulator [Prevotella sp.]|nr:transcriptional regulator [Prevotella sp.]
MALGDYVLISPDLTQHGEWVKGQVIEVEDNSFVGTVISAQTEDGNIFFGKAADFKTVA